MDAQFLRYGKNNLCPMYFGNHIEKQNFPVALQDNKENELEILGNDGKCHGNGCG